MPASPTQVTVPPTQSPLHADWPVLTRYDGRRLNRVALPLGGIGTGTVSLGGRGNLHDWEIGNRPAKGFTPANTFFALRVEQANGVTVTRALEGIMQPPFEGPHGSPVRNHGLPRFRECTFEAAYPFGQVLLADPDVPVTVRLQAFNPLIPADPDRSGIPVAVLRYTVSNPSDASIRAAIAGSLQNFIGTDGTNGAPKQNRNEFRRDRGLAGVLLSSNGVDPTSELWGTIVLATTAREDVTYRTAWANYNWGDSLLDFWDDLSGDGRLDNRQSPVDNPTASLCTGIEIPAGEERSVTFLLTWHFPNRAAWVLSPTGGVNLFGGETIGNYYTAQYADAWDVATRAAADLPSLEADTLTFVSSFLSSDLPEVVKEAALYNLSTLRTQTCFRTPDGKLYGWEGCDDTTGCCLGSCTHVWNYEQATAFLFGTLAQTMREVEFLHATRDDGHMSFRVLLPLERYAPEWGLAAADGQMGCLMKLYRDWQLSGDDDFLRRLWPKARKSLEFCWIPGGWDADQDGVMEGCQHNTMDVEYYGPNPQMGIWYLGALRAAEDMARHLGEIDFADTCHDLFARGSAWIDANLFNGDYYEHHIRPPKDASAIAPGLRHQDMGARDLSNPELQLGAGCLVDQLVGQFLADVCGLGYLVDPDHVRQTLASIMRFNFRSTLYGHFNHMRSFALGNESALLMASYPRGNRPTRPFPYYNEVMTGFEYTAAVHMLYEGQIDAGLQVIAATRARYDGEHRSPFNEAECGHHYARAMASWAAILALTGFHYSAVTQSLTLTAASSPTQAFWSTGYAWGTVAQTPTAGGIDMELTVLHGRLPLRRICLTGGGSLDFEPRAITKGETANLHIRKG